MPSEPGDTSSFPLRLVMEYKLSMLDFDMTLTISDDHLARERSMRIIIRREDALTLQR